MKTQFRIVAILVLLLTISCISERQLSAQQSNISFQVFYDQLSPYGQWVDNPDYGYVWIPDVDANFAPYSTNGHWVMTNYGWTWASDYDWGWASFHYGRWDFDNNYGWFWVPGNEWGPSWVVWRQAEGYYGWAAMRPGIDINMSFNNGYRDNNDHWNFVRDQDFGRTDINQYYVDRSAYNVIIVKSTVINNIYVDKSRNSTYVSGPRRADVQRTTGKNFNDVSIRNNDKPGQKLTDNQLQLYRPQVQKNNEISRKPVPTRVTNVNDIKPVRDRNTAPQNTIVPNHNMNRGNQAPAQQKDIIRQPQQKPVDRQQPVQQPEPQKQQSVQQPVQRQVPQQQPERQRSEPQQQQVQQPAQRQQPELQRQQSVQQPVQRQVPQQQPERQRSEPQQQPVQQSVQRQQPEFQRQRPVQQPERQKPEPQQQPVQQPVQRQQPELQRQQPVQQPERQKPGTQQQVRKADQKQIKNQKAVTPAAPEKKATDNNRQ